MSMQGKKSRIWLTAGLLTGISGLLFAVAVFLPSTQPTVTLGQYALQENDLLDGDTIGYRPWFENGAWQGDIIEYYISSTTGDRSTTAPVGLSCIDTTTCAALLAYGQESLSPTVTPRKNWMARATYRALGADDPLGTWWQSRNVFTYNSAAVGLGNPSGQIAFTWDQLSEPQRYAIDPDKYNEIQLLADPTLNTPYRSDIVNYVRGQRLHEKQNDTVTGSLGDLRNRYSVLGDVTSTPVYIGPPRELLRTVDDFVSFKATNDNRDGRLAFGANDGMLHVLNADTGAEVYSYVPTMVLDKLAKLASRGETYNHTYYVDGELTVGSAQIGASTPVWKTLLVGGGGAGFEGLFALNVTDPAYTSDKLLFEKTGGNWGHVYGKPKLGFIGSDNADPTWYVFSGNGYSTDSTHSSRLMMINLDSQAVTEIPTGTTGGLSAPALLSLDDDNTVELAFAGDLKGDLWMFVINDTNPATPGGTAVKVFDGDPDQPIVNAPNIAKHPSEDGYLVFFGTGSILSATDALNDGLKSGGNPIDPTDYTKKQAIYGIWVDTSDMTTLASNLPYDISDLQGQSVAQTVHTFINTQPNEKVRYVPSPNQVYYSCPFGVLSCPTLYKGWYMNFPNCGERLIGQPFIRAGRVQFVTNNPTGLNCGGRTSVGDAWVMSLHYTQGTDDGTVVYNLNGDSTLDSSDEVPVSGTNYPPVGLNLGPGNIAQPTFARLKAGVDKMFINGLLLPVEEIAEPEDLLGGHIDVVVDSPSNGVIATNDITKHSEGYNNNVNDGLGRAVDGHIHNYDNLFNVDHVDFFQLEPRRGMASLIPASSRQINKSLGESCNLRTDSPVPTGQVEVEATFGGNVYCIEASEGELNRAYDVEHVDGNGLPDPLLATDSNGDPAPYLQSEVNALNDLSKAAFSDDVPDKEFIVALANADRSTSGWLQIGCRVWKVKDYQDMITTQLQGGISPGSLVDTDPDHTVDNKLVFDLEDIITDDDHYACPGDPNNVDGFTTEVSAVARGLSATPTLRIGFGRRAILDEGIHATRSQCVMGLHDPLDKVCYTDEAVLTAAESALAVGPSPTYSYSTCNSANLADVNGSVSITLASNNVSMNVPIGYVRDPDRQLHITRAQSTEGNGYRWRNGALTLQLLDKNINPATDLQQPYSGPFTTTPTAATMLSGAGTHAKAYTVAKVGGKDVVTATSAQETANESGMLYEAAIFWHYSALVDVSRNSDPTNSYTPPEAGCYAGDAYNGKTTIDVGGLTLGEYQALTDTLLDDCEALALSDPTATCNLNRYFELVQIIEFSTSESAVNNALAELAVLLAMDTDLAAYDELRDYAGDKIPEHQKLACDQAVGCDGSDPESNADNDGTPNQVTNIETIDLEARGPNYVFGRRNWIDIKQ